MIYLINCTDRILILVFFDVGPLNIAKLAYFRGLIVQLELVLIILVIELRICTRTIKVPYCLSSTNNTVPELYHWYQGIFWY